LTWGNDYFCHTFSSVNPLDNSLWTTSQKSIHNPVATLLKVFEQILKVFKFNYVDLSNFMANAIQFAMILLNHVITHIHQSYLDTYILFFFTDSI
jgi:hypothetical protein